MRYEVSGRDIRLYEPDLKLDEVLDTGQAFMWNKIDGGYFGYHRDIPLEICEITDGEFLLKNTSEEVFLNIWVDYFDLDTDYAKLREIYSADGTLKKACEFSRGIRLLRQDAWEALICYIFSSNNNITRIKGIVSRLREHYGRFPTSDELSAETPETLGFLRSGFRAKYIVDAAKKVSEGEVNLEVAKKLDYDSAKAMLMKISGVGPKVADCVLLCGLGFREAFPVDVWIRRVLDTYYSEGFPEEIYPTRGIAQLYLFNYIRKAEETK